MNRISIVPSILFGMALSLSPLMVNAETRSEIGGNEAADYTLTVDSISKLEDSRRMTDLVADAAYSMNQTDPGSDETPSSGTSDKSYSEKQGIVVAGGGWSSCK